MGTALERRFTFFYGIAGRKCMAGVTFEPQLHRRRRVLQAAAARTLVLGKGNGADKPERFGLGGKGIRTPDFQLAKLALYQLSYAPVRKAECRMRNAECNPPPS